MREQRCVPAASTGTDISAVPLLSPLTTPLLRFVAQTGQVTSRLCHPTVEKGTVIENFPWQGEYAEKEGLMPL